MTDHLERIGQIFGDYRLTRYLGGGGFGHVYEASHTHNGSQAAIKILETRLTQSEDFRAFLNEARAIRLRHPHILPLLDFGLSRLDEPFLVMEYAPLGTLRDRHPKGTRLPLPTIITYTTQIAQALQYAHEQRIIHRDVKPENMLVRADGMLLLSDFGIAVTAHSTRSKSVDRSFGGTLPYMAPEQLQGHPVIASDQYALAIVIYEWLAGRRPFRGTEVETIAQHISSPPPSLVLQVTGLANSVETVLFQALAKQPSDRFKSVQAFMEALQHASQSPYLPKPEYRPVLPALVRETPLPTAPPLAKLPPGSVVLPPAPIPKPHGLRWTVGTVLLAFLLLFTIGGGVMAFTLLGRPGANSNTQGTPAILSQPAKGGTWIDDVPAAPGSLLPQGSDTTYSVLIDQAIYTPLFYGDALGHIHPGLVVDIPTVANGEASADLKTWTFKLRPNLKWSDGQPLNADDLAYSFKIYNDPTFGASFTTGFADIVSTTVSPDKLSITMHLDKPIGNFVSNFVDANPGAPLPMHKFSSMNPGDILKSPDSQLPTVTNGPFMIKADESTAQQRYTVVPNPNYYQPGLPYLNKIVFNIVNDPDTILKGAQNGQITSSWFLDVSRINTYKAISGYTVAPDQVSAGYEALWMNENNPALRDVNVRKAIAMAIDHQKLITVARNGFATPPVYRSPCFVGAWLSGGCHLSQV